MKCIKCNYTSFDFNQTCPKCGKNLSAETEKLHLPSYKTSPPYLLTSLTGETGETGHSLGNEQSGVSSFLENQKEDVLMLNKSMMINSPEVHGESSQDDGENEMMVALDELSFEYEPAMEDVDTLESSQSDDLFMPEISQEEIASSTDPILFDKHLTEDDPPFAPMDKADQSSTIVGQIEGSGAIEDMESHLELGISDIDKAKDPSEETDELLMSLEELSFEQEPVSPDDSLEQGNIDEDALSISKLLDFGDETSQDHTDPIIETNPEDKPASKGLKDDLADEFEITTHSDISDQPENVESYIKLDLSDIDQAEDGIEDNDKSLISFEEDGSEKALLEEDGISLIPNMLNPEETSYQGDSEIADLFSDQKSKKAAVSSKGGKTKTDTKEDYIKLDILEMEVD